MPTSDEKRFNIGTVKSSPCNCSDCITGKIRAVSQMICHEFFLNLRSMQSREEAKPIQAGVE